MEGNRSSRAISFHMLKILNKNYHEKETNKCLIAVQDKLAPLMEGWPRHCGTRYPTLVADMAKQGFPSTVDGGMTLKLLTV